MERTSTAMIAQLSVYHMLVDFLCAFSLFHSFTHLPEVFLLYNFCAFALQMPLGILLDDWMLKRRERTLPGVVFTAAGMILTAAGSFLSPLVTGTGNAFFLFFFGVLTIHEDREAQLSGRGLGVFVAPGAIGLFLGITFHATVYYRIIQILVCLALVLGCLALYSSAVPRPVQIVRDNARGVLYTADVCFTVVVLRSLCGMAVVFPWKSGFALSFFSVLCLACGKAAGGFVCAAQGMKRTVVCTLVPAALCYALAQNAACGLAALFLFNMTMPLTLYRLAEAMPSQPGFAFGILTFGLFLGYLPVYYGAVRDIAPFPAGTVISLVSLVLLYLVVRHDG